MSDKTAFIFDTNFIIQNRDLDVVIQKLKEKEFVVYITQVAIDERIAQECNKQREKYDAIERFRQQYVDIISIKILKKYEDTMRYYKEGMRKKYEKLFGENIIQLLSDSDTFSRVLERAYAKTPPFIKGSSDKGFKDTLMWMSIIDYFMKNGESEVVFVTDDNGFRDNAEALEEEFSNVTGKSIEIKNNSYYKELIVPKLVSKQQEEIKKTINLTDLRNEIQETIDALCYIEEEGYWGEPEWKKTFTTFNPFDAAYVAQIFEQLESKIESHILEKSIPAQTVFDVDDRIKEGNVNIPIMSLEKALKLYLDIKNQHADYIQQFYFAVAGISNQNCQCLTGISDDKDLPF